MPAVGDVWERVTPSGMVERFTIKRIGYRAIHRVAYMTKHVTVATAVLEKQLYGWRPAVDAKSPASTDVPAGRESPTV